MKYLIYISILFFILFNITPSFAVNTTSTIGDQIDLNNHTVSVTTTIDKVKIKDKDGKTWIQKTWNNLVEKKVSPKNKKRKKKNNDLDVTTKLSYWWIGTALGCFVFLIFGWIVGFTLFSEAASNVSLILLLISLLLAIVSFILLVIWLVKYLSHI